MLNSRPDELKDPAFCTALGSALAAQAAPKDARRFDVLMNEIFLAAARKEPRPGKQSMRGAEAVYDFKEKLLAWIKRESADIPDFTPEEREIIYQVYFSDGKERLIQFEDQRGSRRAFHTVMGTIVGGGLLTGLGAGYVFSHITPPKEKPEYKDYVEKRGALANAESEKEDIHQLFLRQNSVISEQEMLEVEKQRLKAAKELQKVEAAVKEAGFPAYDEAVEEYNSARGTALLISGLGIAGSVVFLMVWAAVSLQSLAKQERQERERGDAEPSASDHHHDSADWWKRTDPKGEEVSPLTPEEHNVAMRKLYTQLQVSSRTLEESFDQLFSTIVGQVNQQRSGSRSRENQREVS